MLEVGRIHRPHGLRGEVVVSLTTNRAERLDPGSVLDADGRVLTVVRARPNKDRYIVAFDGLTRRDDAEAIQGRTLRAEPIDDPDELWVHDLIGATVVDQLGVDRGSVVGVLENPASDLLELDSGALVPVRFVAGFDPGGEVRVDAPDGLFDIAEP